MKIKRNKTKSFFVTILLTVASGPVLAAVPNIYTAGDTIIADEMNENFNHVVNSINNISTSPVARGDYIPVIEDVIPTSVPSVPTGLRVSCNDIFGNTTPTCPVVKWNGVTYWAFSFMNNDTSMQIVGFDSNGQIVSSTIKTGARYLSGITVDVATQVITFTGQSGFFVTMGYTVPWLLNP